MAQHIEDRKLDEKEASLFKNPQMTVLNFTLVGITSLFIGLTVAYLLSSSNWTWKQFQFPKLFLLSALVLAGSSWFIHQAVKAFEQQNQSKSLRMMGITVSLSLVFVVAQVFGWFELQNEGIYLGGKPDGSYLYIISGLHALHVVAGILPLIWFYLKTLKKRKKPVEALLFFNAPNNLRQFRLIEKYWHFVDLLWIYLLFFFLFNHL